MGKKYSLLEFREAKHLDAFRMLGNALDLEMKPAELADTILPSGYPRRLVESMHIEGLPDTRDTEGGINQETKEALNIPGISLGLAALHHRKRWNLPDVSLSILHEITHVMFGIAGVEHYQANYPMEMYIAPFQILMEEAASPNPFHGTDNRLLHFAFEHFKNGDYESFKRNYLNAVEAAFKDQQERTDAARNLYALAEQVMRAEKIIPSGSDSNEALQIMKDKGIHPDDPFFDWHDFCIKHGITIIDTSDRIAGIPVARDVDMEALLKPDKYAISSINSGRWTFVHNGQDGKKRFCTRTTRGDDRIKLNITSFRCPSGKEIEGIFEKIEPCLRVAIRIQQECPSDNIDGSPTPPIVNYALKKFLDDVGIEKERIRDQHQETQHPLEHLRKDIEIALGDLRERVAHSSPVLQLASIMHRKPPADTTRDTPPDQITL